MWNILNKPYPFNDDLKHNTKIIFFTSLGVFVFLLLFQPFGIGSLPVNGRYYLMIGMAVVTFLSLSLNLLVIPSLFPKKFTPADWNVLKEIIWDTWMLFTTLAGFFLLNNYLGVMKLGFSLILKLTLTAVVPISAMIIINHNNILRSHVKLADEISRKLKENKSIQEKVVYFNSDYQKDSLAIKVSSLLVIRSANNYVEIFWKEGDIIKNQMVRCSMLNAEEAVKEYKFIIKCHRSFMVNINHIDKIEGSSQGYRLFLEYITFPVPISKNSVARLKELI